MFNPRRKATMTQFPPMKRSRIALPDDMIRAFSGHGAVSLRDHTVTGLRNLQMTPFEQRGWEFELSFVDVRTQVVIRDFADVVWAFHRGTEQGMHPLAINFGTARGAVDFDPSAGDHHERTEESEAYLRGLVLQSATWQPNRIRRQGTYHKRIDGVLTSFAILTEARCSPSEPVAYLAVEIRNREDHELELEVRPVQRVRRGVSIDHRADDQAEHIDWHAVAGPVAQWPGGRTALAARFVVRVDADLPSYGDHWRLVVPPRSSVTTIYRITAGPEDAPPRSIPSSEIPDRFESDMKIYEDRRSDFAGGLPRLSATPELEHFYATCVQTVFEARWLRPDWPVSPFYSAGTWLATLAWDTSFSSGMLAINDPHGLRRTLLALVGAGLTKHSYLLWDGGYGPHYAYTLFAAARAVRDYLDVTGDLTLLDEVLENGRSFVTELVTCFEEALRSRRDETGLIWFSDETSDHLETRTDGHQGAVAVINLVAIECLAWVAELPGCDAESSRLFTRGAAEIRAGLDLLWDPAEGWFDNRLSDGTRERFLSFHMFDALTSRGLRSHEQAALVAHIREGEFLGEFGMHSVSVLDEIHFDYDDADWGGGGQYTGMPLRIALDLWRVGRPERAWEILRRCTRWTEAFPYVPQEVYADALISPDVEQPLELAAGAGVQAIVFGMFGVRPRRDGLLTVAPSRQPFAVGFELTGYRHRDESVSVLFDSEEFEVRTSRGSIRAAYGLSIVMKPGEMPFLE